MPLERNPGEVGNHGRNNVFLLGKYFFSSYMGGAAREKSQKPNNGVKEAKEILTAKCAVLYTNHF